MVRTVKELLDTLPQRGRLEHILVRPARRAPTVRLERARALPGRGLAGDHRSERSSSSARQVTLIQAEHLPVITALSGSQATPERLRRNLVVSGINLLALKSRRFRIGGAVFEGAGLCHPCSRMEEALGPGGYNAVRGHGGILARVVEEGEITVGDALEPL
ncbi:MAG: MOSC domain protein [uncultured Truepera sp.]|uniref:MOSC domain protein n=1 Tax=uncultured Truepera sp. TaxID=543023 RepID=A0A6J4V280_9DEIN|nr:MAG: MOSC domain protein [uncultured Truepera sp.]